MHSFTYRTQQCLQCMWPQGCHAQWNAQNKSCTQTSRFAITVTLTHIFKPLLPSPQLAILIHFCVQHMQLIHHAIGLDDLGFCSGLSKPATAKAIELNLHITCLLIPGRSYDPEQSIILQQAQERQNKAQIALLKIPDGKRPSFLAVCMRSWHVFCSCLLSEKARTV